MSRFVPDARLSFEDNGGFPFKLKERVVYESSLLRARITVPVGFKTDMASIPKLLWNVLPPIGKYDAAAVIHDYLYQRPKWTTLNAKYLTRAQSDGVLREAMQILGVGAFTRWVIYAGVRLGGWVPWNNYRKGLS